MKLRVVEILCSLVFLAAVVATVLGQNPVKIQNDGVMDGDCLQECIQGDCNATTSKCDCYVGFVGDNCNVTLVNYDEVYYLRSSLGYSYPEYAIDFFYGNQLRVSINVTDDNPTILEFNLLFKLGGPATPDEHDLKFDSGEIEGNVIDLFNITHGRWFFTFVAEDNYVQLAFLITNRTDCPNSCSGHGQCDYSSYQCTCDSPYQGSDCSYIQYSISGPGTYSGSINQQEWIYFQYFIDPAVTASVKQYILLLNRTSNYSSPYFVADFDRVPDLLNGLGYAWEEGVVKASSLFYIPNNPNYRNFYLGVYGALNSNFSFTFVLDEGCPNDCSAHGDCVYKNEIYPQCQCHENYINSDCSELTTSLVLKSGVTGEITGNAWNYYFVDVPQSNKTVELKITLTRVTSKNKGVPLLFVRLKEKPTITVYDKEDIALRDETVLTVTAHAGERWYIGLTLEGSVGDSSYIVVVSTKPEEGEGWESFGLIIGLVAGSILLLLGLLYGLRWYKRRSRTSYEPLSLDEEEMSDI